MLKNLKEWKSTTAGIAVSTVFFAVFKSLHCEMPSDLILWGAGLLPTLLGAFTSFKPAS
jgi:hypothetical protein